MLSLEEQLSYVANEWNNELALLESCVVSLGFDRSLTAKILQNVTDSGGNQSGGDSVGE